MLDVFKFPDFIANKFSFSDLKGELNKLPLGISGNNCVVKFKQFSYTEYTPFTYQSQNKYFIVYAQLFVFDSAGTLILDKNIALKFSLTEEDIAEWLSVDVLGVYFSFDFANKVYVSSHKDLVTALELKFFDTQCLLFDGKSFYKEASFYGNYENRIFIGLAGSVKFIELYKDRNPKVENILNLLD